MIMSLLPCDPAFFSVLNDLKFPIASGLVAQLYLRTILLLLPFNYKQMESWQWSGEMSSVSSVSGSSYAPSNNHAKIHWGKAALKKINSQLNSKKALNQNQMTLLSQIQCEPCCSSCHPCSANTAWDLASVSCCQLPAVWSWTSCPFSPWPQFPIGVLEEKTAQTLKTAKWQTTVMRRLKLDWHRQKRLLLIL